jgi:hypothetical protein
MSLIRPTFYVEPRTGVAVSALLQLLGLFGAQVVRALPPPEARASYIVIDFEKRKIQGGKQDWIDAWYDARAEVDHPGTLVGLTLEEGHSPVPGACQISVFHILPAVVKLLDRFPRPLSQAQLKIQKQPAHDRQAQIVAHDLERLLRLSNLDSATAYLRMATTLRRITAPILKADLNELLKQIEQSADSTQLRILLGTAVASWRQRYVQ